MMFLKFSQIAAAVDNALIIELVNRQLVAAGLGVIEQTTIGRRRLLIVSYQTVKTICAI